MGSEAKLSEKKN